jgi:simple sugar transport system ATP-binding protein
MKNSRNQDKNSDLSKIREREISIGQTILSMERITKTFPDVIANKDVNFDLKKGEVHALLGENGAGKTTLMNILYGLYKQDEGRIVLKGKEVEIHSPNDAIELGIGMVHQHFMLVDVFSVLENLIIGLKGYNFLIPKKKISKKLTVYADKYGLKIEPEARVWQLSAGEKQRVEIIKALYQGIDILILDEPTSVLSSSEVENFFKMLRKMTKEGKSIIFISHKLDEVMSISDRVTILRHGLAQGTVKTKNTNKRELTKMMIGREIIYRINKSKRERGQVLLETKNLTALNDKGLKALKGISFKVHKGEILGVGGVAGNGQKELIEALTGLRDIENGEVYISGKKSTNFNPRKIIDMDVAHIPEDRVKVGVVPNMSVSENLILKGYRKFPFVKDLYEGKIKIILNEEKIEKFGKMLVKKYDITTPNIDVQVKKLSGGNIQKLILARELSSDPSIIIASHPTCGLDIGATEYIRSILLKEREKGAAIFLISEDLDELKTLSDRIAIMYEGEFIDILNSEQASLEHLGLLMGGEKPKAEED